MDVRWLGTGDLRLQGIPCERGQVTIWYLVFSGLTAHPDSPATLLPCSVACGADSLRASQFALSSQCGRSSAAPRARLVSGNRVQAWHRDGLERPSPIEAPGMLTIESFKSQRIRGPALKSQRA